jgi:hypothetical protein|uniref:Uncharacterized protein n=1 Tax=viral metagenome TaxID=1070528 RepID=A0A6C0C0V1_9ZZZZ
MYNTDFELTYRDISDNKLSDKTYREEFLKFLNLEEYNDDTVSEKLDEIFLLQGFTFTKVLIYISNYNKLPFELSPKDCFPFLFSWEYFSFTFDAIKAKAIENKHFNLLLLWEEIKKSK